jgi:hypothetical protein
MCFNIGVLNFDGKSVNFDKNFGRKFLEGHFAEKFGKKGNFGLWRRKLFFGSGNWKHW